MRKDGRMFRVALAILAIVVRREGAGKSAEDEMLRLLEDPEKAGT